MKKKIIALILCLTVAFAFTACGGGAAVTAATAL